jgi:hypothetical protein
LHAELKKIDFMEAERKMMVNRSWKIGKSKDKES